MKESDSSELRELEKLAELEIANKRSQDHSDSDFTHSPRLLNAGYESARELRQSPNEKMLALILTHYLISAKVAEKRYADPTRYNLRVKVTPILQPSEYIRPSTEVFENVEATLRRVLEVLEGEIPNVIFVDANYSLAGDIPNYELLRALMLQFPTTKIVLHSMTSACILAASNEYKTYPDVACIIRNDMNSNTSFEAERELIIRAKNTGRRHTMTK